MSNDNAKEFQMPKFSLTDQIDWLERNGNDPLDVLTSLRELKRIRERKDLQRNVGCARGQNTTQFCAEAVAAQSKLAKVMEGLREVRESLRAANETPAITDTLWMKSGNETIFDAIDVLLRTIEGERG